MLLYLQKWRQTKELISKLAGILRFAPNMSKQKQISISEEILFNGNYLGIEQRRYAARLSVRYIFEQYMLEHSLRPIFLQPIIENCIKHAVDPTILQVPVYIFVFWVENSIIFQISDTGLGLLNRTVEDLLSKGTGSFNFDQRLCTLFNRGLEIPESRPQGLLISFAIPTQLRKL